MGNSLNKQLAFQLRKRLEKGGPKLILELGKIGGAGKALKRCRKALSASKQWQALKDGMFRFKGQTLLPFCAMLGPVFTVKFDGKKLRLQSILVQEEKGGSVQGYALDAVHGWTLLAKALCLSAEERKALEAMLNTGRDLHGEQFCQMKVTTRKLLPTIKEARLFSSAYEKKELLEVLEQLGEAGREIILAGILHQLSALVKPKMCPPIIVNLVRSNQSLTGIQAILGAVNFSICSWVGSTAPSVSTVSNVNELPFSHGEMELYRAGHNGEVFLAKLEEYQRRLKHSEAVSFPFRAVPLMLTTHVIPNGNVWNIEANQTIPDLKGTQQDCLRAAASSALNPEHAFNCLYQDVLKQKANPSAYRTSTIERWHSALVIYVLSCWFPDQREHASALFLSDEEQRRQRERHHVQELNKALDCLSDPATYQNGGIVSKPDDLEHAESLLKKNYALYYAPSAKKTTDTGPFLCFTNETLQRLLLDNGISDISVDELIHELRQRGELNEKASVINFKSGKTKRFIKLNIRAYPELHTFIQ